MNNGFDILQPNHAGCLILKGEIVAINYGVVRIENEILISYTPEFMKENRHLNNHSEAWLIENKHIIEIPLSNIQRVLF